ncbi:DUF4176 domain-containing protein [Latilactobacillus graminis]|uniref:DUF4176 domain-containing protein n=2 Tax=Latilactobacillus graminis TaxID=60519 RepID=A0AA89I1Y6_9LACO|nr:DUF4176 domain-containing protein [Latilactobacillus graminis]KRM22329.1 hypothetical protein FC90_GL000930 [Latilactobacillus graminis DSM 20719]QFP79497.1 DUF4176 domain-containing protein [Latilactobacillus graminis]
MNDVILPLGSVVALKDSDGTLLTIVSRGALTEQAGTTYYADYGAVVSPLGLVDVDEIYFFNHENIEEVVFVGYCDAQEQEFEADYPTLIASSQYPKLEITK